MERLKVGVIFGGMSSEKEVSLNSGRNVHDNLDRDRFNPVAVFMDSRGGLWILPWQLISQNTTIDISERLEPEARRIGYEELPHTIDFAFLALHGKYGDDGCIQGLMELLGIPYTGPGVLASALGMDKAVQQKVLEASGIRTPRSMVIECAVWKSGREEVEKAVCSAFNFPMVTKPTREGSSFGVTIVKNPGELAAGIEAGLVWDTTVLIEEFLEGVEFSSIVFEGECGPYPLAVTEIRPQNCFYGYDDKYMPGKCRKFTPPKNIRPDIVKIIEKEVIKTFKALEFRSYGRIDGFVLTDGSVVITDPNSSSGMAPSSFFFEQAAERGMAPSMILTELIEISLRVHSRKKGPL
ncbi:MAG: hypothetical protein M0P57_09990 [Syntrophales bacterium]|jgi:D-alanine--D-alanine ligase|nr:hypothetical protein [Syntrophales bacterium]MDY0044082.1 hypothetical protein [Syntrophales bacterium]